MIKKSLLIYLLFLFFNTNLYGDWTLVSVNKQNKNRYYLDLSTAKKSNGYILVWQLADYVGKSPFTNFKKPVSAKVLLKVDCRLTGMKALEMIIYKGYMGSGKIVLSESFKDKKSDWKYFPPKSVGATQIKKACNK